MIDYPFTKQMDPGGHDVVGITFDRPIPWPAFDGPGATVGDEIAVVLTGGAEGMEEKRDALAGALQDLADEITEECEGDLKLAKTGVGEAVTLLRNLRGTFAQATRAFETAQKAGTHTVADAGDVGEPVRAAIRRADTALHEARAEALRRLLNPETADLIAEALAVLGGVETRVSDAITDLSKQAEEARGVYRENAL